MLSDHECQTLNLSIWAEICQVVHAHYLNMHALCIHEREGTWNMTVTSACAIFHLAAHLSPFGYPDHGGLQEGVAPRLVYKI